MTFPLANRPIRCRNLVYFRLSQQDLGPFTPLSIKNIARSGNSIFLQISTGKSWLYIGPYLFKCSRCDRFREKTYTDLNILLRYFEAGCDIFLCVNCPCQQPLCFVTPLNYQKYTLFYEIIFRIWAMFEESSWKVSTGWDSEPKANWGTFSK